MSGTFEEEPPLLTIPARSSDLGGLMVARILPYRRRRSVGPFVFFDHMGPAVMAPGQGINVRPHPHIGLATLTWLLEGRIRHHDSLGSLQEIAPGAVNWMVAGRGIVHSERTPEALRGAETRLNGLQTWLALPPDQEETAPGFAHHPAESLPRWSDDGVEGTVVAGTAFGLEAPARVFSPTLYIDVTLAPGARLALPAEHPERAVYGLSGTAAVGGRPVTPGVFALADGGDPAPVVTVAAEAPEPARLVVIGGAPLEKPVKIWWNFVSSRPERIEQAKADWRKGRFMAVPGEDDALPLPE